MILFLFFCPAGAVVALPVAVEEEVAAPVVAAASFSIIGDVEKPMREC